MKDVEGGRAGEPDRAGTPESGRAEATGLDVDILVERDGFRLEAAIATARREIVAVMGPSGAGKSTLLAAIAGLVHPDSGRVRVRGVEVTGPRIQVPPARRGIVLLGQESRLFPHMDVRTNVAFGLRARGIDRASATATADDWLARVGLPKTGSLRPAVLSGGQQQRVALARALATEPSALLLDEPLTSLDPETADGIRAVLGAQLAGADTTTVIVTHDAVDAAALARRLVVIEDGRVTQDAVVRDVFRAPATPFAATIAGVNRIVGVARDGLWTGGDPVVSLAAGDAASRIALSRDAARVTAVFPPSAVRLTRADGPADPRADGSPVPGEWTARVQRLEQTPSGVRVHTVEPAVAADLTPDAVTSLSLGPGAAVRLAVAAADVRINAIE
ncbi:sulfate/molybdate ABC transporter ATP-binding protein [Microbacterium deminutum]|uniref:ABC transporter ATP-binding protein n=1 Tax=Microbacterium deminutum TaxID=344164 RepID=A0ABN2R3U2_9MICO